MATVQWYPGHMSKARREMEADMKLVELVIEIVDARCPVSSRNPDIDKIAKGKSRLILLNKADLADKYISEKWKKYFEDKGIRVVFINSKQKEGIRNVLPNVKEVCADKIKRNLERGIKNQPIRAMVVGIPNVGKSTFINAFAGRNITKTGDKPGVTKGKQWIKINPELELLDTPGILWPKFEDQEIGKRLAMIGSINDEILVVEELAGNLLDYLYDNYFDLIKERYKIDEDTLKPLEDDAQFVTKESVLLDKVSLTLGCLKKGGVPDYFKAASRFLDEFRAGSIGKISLERP
ncbi:MAG: ribosome biogenesis GTPase YlqF [Lachnospiraceae bacterium]|nr:ribosome biogenesis GTPase YlqF [Lachnospiraceae bacterium]